ncbi:2TM domain-containing protein [Flavobacterium pallidum]|uniref:2TM domain-containing protein n=1 Tax=Flavobacterium pallidum TaxID=2172098 RepID=A0A2S1SLC6_9FLAO|nr:2TM domain-containing protein [Flavobacterium pallidum]AWI27208.1 hypothetical protein HYN49_06030 [Flavobacterium pallidum]
MERDTHEQYEYARSRLRQKKYLFYHFVLFLIGSLFMFVANELLKFGEPEEWDIWASTIWFFIIILHFIKVYIMDRFMNKEWERAQIDRLMAKQQNRIRQLESKIDTEKN